MNAFYKIVENGFITGFGTNGSASTTKITKTEYNSLVAFFKTRPVAPAGEAYLMRDDPREWVLVDIPPLPEEITDSEALEIILGGVEL